MKAAREYRQQWEEANWLRLIYLANQFYEAFYKLTKKALIVINVFLYITYQAFKGLYLIIKLLLLSYQFIFKPVIAGPIKTLSPTVTVVSR